MQRGIKAVGVLVHECFDRAALRIVGVIERDVRCQPRQKIVAVHGRAAGSVLQSNAPTLGALPLEHLAPAGGLHAGPESLPALAMGLAKFPRIVHELNLSFPSSG